MVSKRKKISRATGLVILFMLAGAGVVVAQQVSNRTQTEAPAHLQKAHHGGQVQVAGDYHIELVRNEGNYAVYLLDTRARAINLQGITGQAILRDGDQTTGTYSLSPTQNTHFTFSAKGQAHTAVIIRFKIKDDSIIAKFDNDNRQALN